MIRFALFIALFCVNSAFSQCAGGSCSAPQSMSMYPPAMSYYPAPPVDYYPVQQYQYMPQQAFSTANFMPPTTMGSTEKSHATVRMDAQLQCLHVFDKRGEFLGTIWPEKGAWQFAGKKTMHVFADVFAKEGRPLSNNYLASPKTTLELSKRPRLAVCECGPDCDCYKRGACNCDTKTMGNPGIYQANNR